MGLLNTEYFKNITSSTPSPTGVGDLSNNIISNPIQEEEKKEEFKLGLSPEQQMSQTPYRLGGDVSVDWQKTMHGGFEVGTPEYYKYLEEHPYKSGLFGYQTLSALGTKMPDIETWDKMNPADRATHIVGSQVENVLQMIMSLPKVVAKSAVTFGYNVAQPWVMLAKGESPNIWNVVKNAEEKPLNIPWLGEIPNYWLGGATAKKEAEAAGRGNLGQTAAGAAGFLLPALTDATVTTAFAESIIKAFQPRGKVIPGQTIQDTQPIKNALINESPVAKTESGASYYTLPKTDAAKWGGKNTFVKVSPIDETSFEVSIVQTRGGLIQKGVDYVKDKFGNPTKTINGDFGSEVKLESHIIKQQQGFQFVSPNVEENLTFEQAAKKLGSKEQIRFNSIADDIDTKLNVQGKSYNGIGDWSDGAENTVFKDAIVDNYDQLRYSTALKGKAANQKAVIPFIEDAAGADSVFVLDIPGADLVQLRKDLSEFGVQFRTLVEEGNVKKVVVFDPGTSLTQNIEGLANKYNVQAKQFRGKGEFLGGETREAGVSAYDSVIREYESKFPNNRYDREINAGEASRLSNNRGTGKQNIPEQGATATEITPIPAKALKGFEDKPITNEQLVNLNTISKVNGIEPGIQNGLIKVLTGKNNIAELTQAEYISAAQILSKMSEVGKYVPEMQGANILTQYASPQRHWMRTYEEKSGIPLYSEAYIPVEDAFKLRNIFRDKYRNQARELFGDYAKSGMGEERRLITSYMQGDQAAILKNTKLTPEVKTNLIKVADGLRKMYDDLGTTFGIESQVFLKDYQPQVASLGGVYQLYKDGSALPKELSFFAEFKRHGSAGVKIDDALALFDIYTNAGSNKLFLNPALDRVAALTEKLPANLQSSVKSYVQEKLGYAGNLERWMDSLSQSVNKKLGTNLPSDLARQLTDLGMSTMYSGGLTNPASILRNSLQYDLLTYPRLGSKFYLEAAQKALTKEGMKWAADRGFLLELGVPYGEELAAGEISVFGKAGNAYKNVTQATMKPYTLIDNINRSRTAWQTKLQFEDALARYNSGKITWSQLESQLDFKAFSVVDRNIIRQNLIKGNVDGALNHMIRDVIDETQFPYRRGASSRITYGLGGKLSTSFLQWPIEFAHTAKKWVLNGQWDQMIRFIASSTVVRDSFKEAFGMDFSKSVYAGPLQNVGPSPFIKTALNVYNMGQSFIQDNNEEFEKNKDEIVRTLKSLGMPAGVQIQNFRRFMFSYNKGVDSQGMYGVYDDRGRLRYKTTFSDIFGQMFGFPSIAREEQTNLQKEMMNAKFDRTEIKKKVLEMYQREEYDDANKLIEQYGIQITPADMDQYYIPLTQRTFESLPAQLKAQFAPKVFK